MILRKPYAFFIKYFRLFNLIMAILMGIMIYHTGKFTGFLFKYANNYMIINSDFSISNYINIYIFLIIILIIIFTVIVLSVTIVKNKPKKLYIMNLLIYVLIIVLYYVDYSVLRQITETVLDVRIAKALRDVTFIGLLVQIIPFILTIVRTTGFDIKKFDFASDLQKLDIDVKDNEEFEVAVEFDSNKARRNLRRNVKNIKYFYLEHKFFINVGFVIFSILVVFLVFFNYTIYNAQYTMGKYFEASSVGISVKGAYLIDKDYYGDTIDDDNKLVVVRIDVRGLLGNDKQTLNTGLITLLASGVSYGKTTDYYDYVDDLGTGYVDQGLTDEYVSYLLVYKVPKNINLSGAKLKINDDISYVRGEIGAKNNYVKLKIDDLSADNDVILFSKGDTLSFSGSYLGETTFSVSDFAVANRFKLAYKFCSKKDRCYDSYEYVTPTATGNYWKTLLKLKYNYELDDDVNIEDIDDVLSLLNKYGYFYYKIGNDWHYHKIDSQLVRPNVNQESNVIYLEVNKEAENADSIYILFKVRNYSFKYVLK